MGCVHFDFLFRYGALLWLKAAGAIVLDFLIYLNPGISALLIPFPQRLLKDTFCQFETWLFHRKYRETNSQGNDHMYNVRIPVKGRAHLVQADSKPRVKQRCCPIELCSHSLFPLSLLLSVSSADSGVGPAKGNKKVQREGSRFPWNCPSQTVVY